MSSGYRQFTQLCAVGATLYALTENGEVWRFAHAHGVWVIVEDHRVVHEINCRVKEKG